MTVMNDCVNDARVLNEAQALIDHGHQVEVLGYSGTTEAWSHEKGQVQVRNLGRPWFHRHRHHVSQALTKAKEKTSLSGAHIPVLKICRGAFFKLLKQGFIFFSHLNYQLKALAVILNAKPKIVHCHDLNTLPVGVLAKMFLPVKLIYDSHELWSDQNPFVKPNAFRQFAIRQIEKILIRRSDATITVSESIADELAAVYKIPTPVVLRNCKVSFVEQSVGLKQRMGLASDQFLAVYTGLITGGRGLEDLLEVLPLYPNLQLAMVGPNSPDFVQGLKERALANSILSRVHFLPPVAPQEVPSFISGADFAFIPAKNTCRSYYLSLSNKFFEAVAAGLPVLTSNFPEFNKLVKLYDLGSTYDPADLESLRQATQSMMNHERLQLWQNNSRHAILDLNWIEESKKLTSLYQSFRPVYAPKAETETCVELEASLSRPRGD